MTEINKQVIDVLNILKSRGYCAWLVGGAVRDYILNIQTSDYDIATNATPEKAASILFEYNPDTTYKKYGCIKIAISNIKIELTTFRKDIQTDGRKALVQFSNKIEEDALRRDFTINALYWDGDKNWKDFFNSKQDILNENVKFIGDADIRVQEDYLRIMRFFRFSAHYAKNIDEEGLKACVNHQENLRYISGLRLHQECLKMLQGKNKYMALKAMEESGILRTLFGCKANIEAINKFSGKSPLLLTRLIISDLLLKFLEHRLQLNRQEIDILKIADSLEENTDFKNIYFKHKAFAKELVYFWSAKFNKDYSVILSKPFWNKTNISFPLSGKDLLSIGCNQGANIGKYLKLVCNWWIENDFSPNKMECLDYAKKFISTDS